MGETRTALYLALAEALAEPPAWMARPGGEWPLFASAQKLAPRSPAAARALPALRQIGAESVASRRARYRRLFAGPGRPRFWLYESLYLGGRLPGPQTFAVGRLYAVAGLQIKDGELPDHASLELSFLGYLAGEAAAEPHEAHGWRQLERQFVKKHAGRWLPTLGRELAASGDPVYAPIGRLLADVLREVTQQGRVARKRAAPYRPQVTQAACTLCGFCVQGCPTQALAIEENAWETTLVLAAKRCSGCGLCTRTCDTGAITLGPTTPTVSADPEILRRSPRPGCRGCGQPLVSRAELTYVAGQLGHPPWLEYCLTCRAHLLEN